MLGGSAVELIEGGFDAMDDLLLLCDCRERELEGRQFLCVDV